MKNKKIILEAATLIFGTMIIISGTQVSSLKVSESEYGMQNESKQNNNMIFFGFGHISLITIDGKDYLKGVIKGNISIENSASQTWIPYFLLIKDNVNNLIELKWSLPEEFILKNFTGVGMIEFNDIPRNGPEWTGFFLMGSFEKILYI